MRVTDLPDLSDWQKVEVWTIDEAALLWSAIDPFEMKSGNFDEYIDGVPFDFSPKQAKKARMHRRAIIEAVCGGTLSFVRAIELHEDYQNGNGAWESEINFPNLPDPEKIITSKTRVQQAAFMKWAKSKNIPSYREQVIRANALAKNDEFADSLNKIPKKENIPLLLPATRLLTADHPRAPRELLIAMEVWGEVVTNERLDNNGKSLKSNARKILDTDEKYSGISNSAKERISTVANADTGGGAPKTP